MSQGEVSSFLDTLVQLRLDNHTRVESSSPASAVVYLQDEDIRLGHLLTLIPFTSERREEDGGGRVVSTGRTSVNVAGWLAWEHFNTRSDAVVPGLRERLKHCNFYWTLSMADTRAEASTAVGIYQDFAIRGEDQPSEQDSRALSLLRNPIPIAFAGTGRSSTSIPVSILSGVLETPMVSCCATTTALDSSPFFARTTSTFIGDAQAAVEFYASIGRDSVESSSVSHFGVVFTGDTYGRAYARAVFTEAAKRGKTAVLFEWDLTQPEAGLENVMIQMKESRLHYFFGIIYFTEHKDFIRSAYEIGIMGSSEYVWVFADGMAALTADEYFLEAGTPTDDPLIDSLNGIGVLQMSVPPSERYDDALNRLHEEVEMQERLKSMVTDSDLLTDFDLTMTSELFFARLHYDAVMALGIAACDAEDDFFTGNDLYQALKSVDFEGASGRVQFDQDTGTRYSGLRFGIKNVLTNPVDESGRVTLRTSLSTVVNFAEDEVVSVLEPYVFHDGTTDPPASLEPVVEDQNLLGPGVRLLGWIICALIILVSVGWSWWTWKYRNLAIVKISQPFFLYLLLVGTIVLASAIIPMSFQEPMKIETLDAACMAVPWLISVGFTTVFSALFTKMGRIGMLYKNSLKFKRVKVEVRDVMAPFLVLLSANLVILITWNVFDPWVWNRVDRDLSFDDFGRNTQSFGSCLTSTGEYGWRFLAPLLFVNVVALALANFLAFRTRDLPSQFNESTYIWMTMASLLETFLLAVPIMAIVSDDPTTSFVTRCILIFLFSLAVVAPTFIPKYLNKDTGRPPRRRQVRISTRDHAMMGDLTLDSSYLGDDGRKRSAGSFLSFDYHSVGRSSSKQPVHFKNEI